MHSEPKKKKQSIFAVRNVLCASTLIKKYIIYFPKKLHAIHLYSPIYTSICTFYITHFGKVKSPKKKVSREKIWNVPIFTLNHFFPPLFLALLFRFFFTFQTVSVANETNKIFQLKLSENRTGIRTQTHTHTRSRTKQKYFRCELILMMQENA